MKRLATVVIALTMLLLPASVAPTQAATQTSAQLKNAQGQAVGTQTGVNAALSTVVDNGSITSSVTLINNSATPAANLYLAIPVPAGVTDVKATATPTGAWFKGVEGGVAAWLLDQVPANGTVGPFTYTGTVAGATPGPVSAFVHWLNPTDGTTMSAPALPMIKGLPAGVVQVSGVVPGMGEHWANPKDLPLGPIYGVYGGKIIFLEYMISQEDFAKGVNHTQLLGNKNLPPIDHIDFEFEPQGHEGYPIPHYDVHLYMVPHAQHEAIRP